MRLKALETNKFVKYIFESYADGMSFGEISRGLKKLGARPENGGNTFSRGTIRAILYNETYCGDRSIQKQPHWDFLTKEPKWEEDYDTVFVEEAHESIIDRGLWQKVQDRLAVRKAELEQGINKMPYSHALAGKVICGCCGNQYRRVKVGKRGKYCVVWKCKDRLMGAKGNGCKGRIIKEDKLLGEIKEALAGKFELVTDDDYRGIRSVIIKDSGVKVESRES